MKHPIAAAVLCLLALPVAHAADFAPGDPPVRQRDGILVDAKGRGVYTFDNDTQPGVSTCNNQCRLLWPPIYADETSRPKGQFTVAKRTDGTLQWAYKGKPMYRWASDKVRGDHGGERVTGWHLITLSKPTTPAAPVAAAPATSTEAKK